MDVCGDRHINQWEMRQNLKAVEESPEKGQRAFKQLVDEPVADHQRTRDVLYILCGLEKCPSKLVVYHLFGDLDCLCRSFFD